MKRLLEASAAAVLGNDDLLAEILLCLPLKSLVRSKSISKHWLSLITSPCFSGRLNPNPNLHSDMFLDKLSSHPLNIAPSVPKVCYVPINNNTKIKNNQDGSIALDFFNENPDFYVQRSCKGLLLLCDSNVDQEVLMKMPMPPVPCGSGDGDDNQGDFRYIKYFGESEDHLNLVELEVSNAVEFKVYEMESDYSGWFVKYCVDLHEVILTFLEMIMRFGSNQCYLYSILGIVRRENDGEYFLLLCIGGKIISYSLEDKRFKKSSRRHGLLGTDECTRITLPWYRAYPYIQSLSSV